MPHYDYEQLKATQIECEEAFSRKGIKKAVKAYMDTIPEVTLVVNQGVELLKNWCEADSAYASKQVRRDHISQMDLKDLVEEVFIRIASLTTETTLNNLASQLAPLMGFSDTRVGIQAMAEVIAVICESNFFDLHKYNINSSIYVKSNFHLPDELLAYIERACFLPPMIIKPKLLKDNRSSGYLTVRGDSLILGGGHNHHNDNISLDVLNIMNRYPLSLCEYVLDNVTEEPTSDLDKLEDTTGMTQVEILKAISQQKKNWEKHLTQSKFFYNYVREHGNNRMFITHKYDKRGRIYSQGYHIHIQGTSYKKAILELHDKQHVEVPDDYFANTSNPCYGL